MRSTSVVFFWPAKGVNLLKRISIGIPDDTDRLLLELRKDDRFVRCSYAEIVRQVLELGLAAEAGKDLSNADSA